MLISEALKATLYAETRCSLAQRSAVLEPFGE
jgi:hypothetical protein